MVQQLSGWCSSIGGFKLLLKALCGFADVGDGKPCVGFNVAPTHAIVSGPPTAMGACQGWGLGLSSSRSPSVQRSLQHSCFAVTLNGGTTVLGQARSVQCCDTVETELSLQRYL